MSHPYSKNHTREETNYEDLLVLPVRHLGYVPLVPVSGSERRLEVFERSDGVISFRRQLNAEQPIPEKFTMVPTDMLALVIDLASAVHECGRDRLKLLVTSVGTDQWSAYILQHGGNMLHSVVRDRATQAIEDLADELLELAKKKESELAKHAENLRRFQGDR